MPVWSCREKALCPASSAADKIVRQVLFFRPVPGCHNSHHSKMSVHVCSHRRWSVSAIRITEGSTPRKVATCFQSAATSRTTMLMSSSVRCKSMLKWVGVSVEGETRVGGIDHRCCSRFWEPLTCVKLHVSNVKKELWQSPSPPPPTDIPRISTNESVK